MLDRDLHQSHSGSLSNGKRKQSELNGFARESWIKKGMDGSDHWNILQLCHRKWLLNGMFLTDDTKATVTRYQA
jgi:hypothetical protein